MSMNFEKSVKGGTKVKLAPPKSKYVEHILLATQSGEAGVAEVFRTLTPRLRDSTWTVAFKSLIIVHLMIKEGAQDATLRYLAAAPKNRLAINTFTDVQTQGHNIRLYSEYLLARAQAFAASRCDYVRSGDRYMKGLSVDKGLLRETELVQQQIRALVKCDLLTNDVENEISLTAFRLLTRDLLDLYHVENEAVMSVLSHYFEMSKPDAERAIHIYKNFCKQTDLVVKYLGVARQYEHATRLEIPKIKHAPTSLAQSLQEYIDDKDFEVNRRQYLAEQEAKRIGKPAPKKAATQSQPAKLTPAETQQRADAIMQPAAPPAAAAKGPAPDLIDFFESIEMNQQPMTQNAPAFQQQPQQQPQPTGFPMQSQQTGFVPQQAFGVPQQPQQTGMQSTNPFGVPHQQQQPPPQPLQTQFTGAGFGGYGAQPMQQQQTGFPPNDAFGSQQQTGFPPSEAFGSHQQTGFPPNDAFGSQQMQSPAQMQSPQAFPMQQQGLQPQPTGSTNPFRQSTMPTGAETAFAAPQRQGTNPFARGTQPQQPSAFPSQPQQQPQAFSPQPTAQQQSPPPMLQAQQTGTNPFARSLPAATPSMPQQLQVQPTGSTNPFRQSAFVNHETGQGWQVGGGQQTTMGGLENLETIPVFPRPGQMQAQGQQQSPWG
ncbi:hypothetical protein LTR78_005228 [Recurvomyces mirabilis]|uniref:ENTH domain-containing protein n=1 Tax=Recurvomyces mirabilis TaxID=574656 RepID=A0AAE0WNJ2_9PEZI|nr:hypothetical protein LTR78_005228 [Recurvomyces mirabilis]KAK5157778.1 hypothetical protein LTS14_003700 [Recurvomyces mirabilis]